MARVEEVTYMVKVVAEVDTEERCVQRVTVLDEHGVLAEDEDPESDAVKIAEAVDWPGWTFGY